VAVETDMAEVGHRRAPLRGRDPGSCPMPSARVSAVEQDLQRQPQALTEQSYIQIQNQVLFVEQQQISSPGVTEKLLERFRFLTALLTLRDTVDEPT
jgi:hypothetical protein